MTIYETVIDYS